MEYFVHESSYIDEDVETWEQERRYGIFVIFKKVRESEKTVHLDRM